MAIIRTEHENAVKDGKAFTYHIAQLSFIDQAVEVVSIETGAEEITIESIAITSTGELLLWKAYEGGTIQSADFTVQAVPRHLNQSATPQLTVKYNVTPATQGTPLVSEPVVIIGQVAAGNRSFIDTDLLSDELILKPNETYFLEVANNSGSACELRLTINVRQVTGV